MVFLYIHVCQPQIASLSITCFRRVRETMQKSIINLNKIDRFYALPQIFFLKDFEVIFSVFPYFSGTRLAQLTFLNTDFAISFFVSKWRVTLNLKEHRTKLKLVAHLFLAVWFLSNRPWSRGNPSLHSSESLVLFQLEVDSLFTSSLLCLSDILISNPFLLLTWKSLLHKSHGFGLLDFEHSLPHWKISVDHVSTNLG